MLEARRYSKKLREESILTNYRERKKMKSLASTDSRGIGKEKPW